MSNEPAYRLRSLAKADLEAIWLYTYQAWGIEQADRYLELLINRFSWLADNPLLGKQRDDIKTGYRCFPEGRHLIFYTINKKKVNIIGIVHQSMDADSHLGESP